MTISCARERSPGRCTFSRVELYRQALAKIHHLHPHWFCIIMCGCNRCLVHTCTKLTAAAALVCRTRVLPFIFVGLMACLLQVEVRGQMVTLLKKGSYFGEIGLLRNARRSACVRAVSDTCDLFVLTKVGPAAWHNAPATEWVDDCKGCIRCMQRHLLASSGCTAQSDGIEMMMTHQDLA